jgi:hypothetical protein
VARLGEERVLKQLGKDHGLKPIRPAAPIDQQPKSDNPAGVRALAARASPCLAPEQIAYGREFVMNTPLGAGAHTYFGWYKELTEAKASAPTDGREPERT